VSPRVDVPGRERGAAVRGHVTSDPGEGHVGRNRAAWTAFAPEYADRAPSQWSREEIDWGIWGIKESALEVLGDIAGLDAVELGCGTAYFSAWLARSGARPVGVDVTPAQLATARAMQDRFELRFPLIEASAEAVPLAGESFDLALSEYGASIWCDPYRWIPEAARLLRPGGRLVFLCNGVLLMLTEPAQGAAGQELLRDYFGMHRFEWPDDGSVEFHLGYGDWIRVLRANGFEVERLIEIQAPEGGSTRFDLVTPEWARRWPSEEIWVARKLGGRA
jgi:SAM-dependent methyltransferase